ncbi:putative N-acetyltransferase YitI-like [Tropilaelaps mercedesae]|uniref:Putative N-acetyltransferase YitI-like n=1 Tax=Tropilaelaps mercedesae TaxID=418985 RepID=A0A1V9XRL2_9ACAR|nr:putative N-acetyltransferase YitI-like [Tropilaelaps mercedesae]
MNSMELSSAGDLSIFLLIRRINYEDTCSLRREVLRPDLDIVFYEGDRDPTSIHLGAFVANELVGVISLFQEDFGEVTADESAAVHLPTPTGATQWRIRGFAVAAKMRSKGLGTKLIEACMRWAHERGGRMVWCVARCTAEVVYKRQGFNRTGDVFAIEGVGRVVHMFKNI